MSDIINMTGILWDLVGDDTVTEPSFKLSNMALVLHNQSQINLAMLLQN